LKYLKHLIHWRNTLPLIWQIVPKKLWVLLLVALIAVLGVLLVIGGLVVYLLMLLLMVLVIGVWSGGLAIYHQQWAIWVQVLYLMMSCISMWLLWLGWRYPKAGYYRLRMMMGLSLWFILGLIGLLFAAIQAGGV
jgi:hypothetical protein